MEHQTATGNQFYPSTAARVADVAKRLQSSTAPCSSETSVAGSSHSSCRRRVQTVPTIPQINHAWTCESPIEVPNHYVHRSSPSPVCVRNYYVGPDIANTDAAPHTYAGGMGDDAAFVPNLFAGRGSSSSSSAHDEGHVASGVGRSPIDCTLRPQNVAASRDDTDVKATRPCISTNINLQQEENHVTQQVGRPLTLPLVLAATGVAHLELSGRRAQTDPAIFQINHAWTCESPVEVPDHYVQRSSPSPLYVRNYYVGPDIANTDALPDTHAGGMGDDAAFVPNLFPGRSSSTSSSAHDEGHVVSGVGRSPIDCNLRPQNVAASRDDVDVKATMPCISTDTNFQKEENHVTQQGRQPLTLPRVPAATSLAHPELNFHAEKCQGRQSGGEPQTTCTTSREDSGFLLFMEPRMRKEIKTNTLPQLHYYPTAGKDSATRLYKQLRKQMEREREEAALAKRLAPRRPNIPASPQADSTHTSTNNRQQRASAFAGVTSFSGLSKIEDEHQLPVQPCVSVARSGPPPVFHAERADIITTTNSLLEEHVPQSHGRTFPPPFLSSYPTCQTLDNNCRERSCTQQLGQDCGIRDNVDLGCTVAQNARYAPEIVNSSLSENVRHVEAAGDQKIGLECFAVKGRPDTKARLYLDLIPLDNIVFVCDAEAEPRIWAAIPALERLCFHSSAGEKV